MVSLNELFDIKNGLSSDKVLLYDKKIDVDCIPYIRPSYKQSGTIAGYVNRFDVNEKYVFKKDNLFVSTNGEGSHSYSYVSNCDFVPNSDVSVLLPKVEMDLISKMFYAMIITKNRFRFSYGRKPKGDRLMNIQVPSLNQIPTWIYEIDIEKQKQRLSKKSIIEKELKLEDREWGWFEIGEVFSDIKKTKPEHKINLANGNVRYISRTAFNNGVAGFGDSDELEKINQANQITIGGEGVVAFYQDKKFITGNNITVLANKYLNRYTAMFLIVIINKSNYKYNYGRARNKDRIEHEKIKLPITKSNTPDYQFMEDYIKSLKYSSNLKQESRFENKANGNI